MHTMPFFRVTHAAWLEFGIEFVTSNEVAYGLATASN